VPHREHFDQHEFVRQAHQPSEVMTAITWEAARRTKVQGMHAQMPARHVASRFGRTICSAAEKPGVAFAVGWTILIFACAFSDMSRCPITVNRPVAAPKPGQGFGIAHELAEQFHGTLTVGRHDDNTVATTMFRTMR
jgi:hypothetical protein